MNESERIKRDIPRILAPQKASLKMSCRGLLKDMLAEYVFGEDDLIEMYFEENELETDSEDYQLARDAQHDMIVEILDEVLKD